MLLAQLKKQRSPIVQNPTLLTQPQTACSWALKVRITSCPLSGSRSVASGTHDMSSFHHNRGEQCSLTPYTYQRQPTPPSLSLFKSFYYHQLIIALYLTRNHGFRHCAYGRPLSNNSIDHWVQLRHMGTWKTGCKPTTHAHFSLKRTQEVAPRPRPMRVLLPSIVETLGVWCKGGK